MNGSYTAPVMAAMGSAAPPGPARVPRALSSSSPVAKPPVLKAGPRAPAGIHDPRPGPASIRRMQESGGLPFPWRYRAPSWRQLPSSAALPERLQPVKSLLAWMFDTKPGPEDGGARDRPAIQDCRAADECAAGGAPRFATPAQLIAAAGKDFIVKTSASVRQRAGSNGLTGLLVLIGECHDSAAGEAAILGLVGQLARSDGSGRDVVLVEERGSGCPGFPKGVACHAIDSTAARGRLEATLMAVVDAHQQVFALFGRIGVPLPKPRSTYEVLSAEGASRLLAQLNKELKARGIPLPPRGQVLWTGYIAALDRHMQLVLDLNEERERAMQQAIEAGMRRGRAMQGVTVVSIGLVHALKLAPSLLERHDTIVLMHRDEQAEYGQRFSQLSPFGAKAR